MQVVMMHLLLGVGATHPWKAVEPVEVGMTVQEALDLVCEWEVAQQRMQRHTTAHPSPRLEGR